MASPSMQHCIDNCTRCHQECAETLQHCLQMGGKHVEPEHVKLMLDCIEICQTSANFMLRESSLHHLTCGACAEVCAKCAEDCERMGDEMMKRCAEVCRTCAESCGNMSKA